MKLRQGRRAAASGHPGGMSPALSSGHDGTGTGPIARPRAAADGPRPHAIRRARHKVCQHNPPRLREDASLHPRLAAIRAGLQLIRLGIAHRGQLHEHLSAVSFHRWKKQFGQMDINEARRLKELERENSELKKMLAESLLKNRVLEAVCEKKL